MNTFASEVKFQGRTYEAGAPFVAVTDGFGLRRGNPELRRMLGLAQVALEGADPANTAPYMHGDRTLTYATGETVSTRAFYINTMGDSECRPSAGVMMGRAAGLDRLQERRRSLREVGRPAADRHRGRSRARSRRGAGSTRRAGPVLMDVDDLARVVRSRRWLRRPSSQPAAANSASQHRSSRRRHQRAALPDDGTAGSARLPSAQARAPLRSRLAADQPDDSLHRDQRRAARLRPVPARLVVQLAAPAALRRSGWSMQ